MSGFRIYNATQTFHTDIVVPEPTSDTTVTMPSSGTVVTTNDVGVANSALVKTALNASGTAPIYACRAWVNFNGIGTVAIRASGNVSSITDNGTGDYTVNFTTAMPDGNAVLSGAAALDSSGNLSVSTPYNYPGSSTTTYFRFQTRNLNNALQDSYTVNVAFHR